MSRRLKQSLHRSYSGDTSRTNDDREQNKRRTKSVFGRIKNKLSRQRSGSTRSEEDQLNAIPFQSKSVTLPARVNDYPRSIYEPAPKVDQPDEELLPHRGSDEDSVDSGLDRDPRHLDGSESDSSPRQSKMASLYDEIAVEKAFGPAMKDIGRWYSSHQQARQRMNSNRHSAEAERDRLGSRPPLPLPHERSLLSTSKKVSQDSVLADIEEVEGLNVHVDLYDKVLPRLLGTNGLMLGLRDLACHGWYWGPMTRVEAEEKLAGCNDGTFLVRDSSDERYLLSLSFRSQGKTLHTRIEYSNGFFSFYSFPDSENEGYRSVVELMEKSMQYSSVGVFCFSRARAMGSPAVPVRLLKPLSRFFHVQSLQHYCRFVIRQSIRFDTIRQLPLPKHVHKYLEKTHF